MSLTLQYDTDRLLCSYLTLIVYHVYGLSEGHFHELRIYSTRATYGFLRRATRASRQDIVEACCSS